MKVDRYVPNHAGLQDILVSLGVEKEVRGRAERVAAAAQAMYDSGHYAHTGRVTVDVDSGISGDRARAAVIARHPAALPIEAKHRILGHAIDAAG